MAEPATEQYPMATRAFGLAIIVLSGLQLMVVLDATVVILALPRLQAQMGLSSAGSAWMVTAYGLTYGGLMLLGGRIGDYFGRKRMLVVGVSVFTSASLACGLAQDQGMLIAARAVQGGGAALAAPLAMALVVSTYAPGRARNQAIAIFGSMMGVGSVGGLVVGGALTQLSWRCIFLINVPIGVLVVVGALYCLRDSGHRRLALDIRGAVLGTLACVAIVFGGTEGPEMGWRSPIIVGSLVIGAVLFVVFVVAERQADNPLLPWSLFDNRDRVVTFAATFLASAVLGAMTFYVAQFLQNVLGFTPLEAGLASIPFTIGVGAGGALASKLALYVTPRWILGGAAAILVAGLFYGSTLDGTVSYLPTLLVLLVVVGFGVGVVVVLVPLCLLVGVAPTDIGPLSAVGQMMLTLGGPIAIGLITPIATSRTLALGGTTGSAKNMDAKQLDALTSGYTLALFVCAIGALIAGLILLTVRYTSQQVSEAQAAQEAAQQE